MPLPDKIQQHRGRRGVDRGEWLVEQNDGRVLHHQSGEQRPLQLTRRQLADPALEPLRQPDRRRGRDGLRPQHRSGCMERANLLPAAEHDQLRDRQREVGVEECALRQVGQPLRRGAFDAAAGRPHDSGDRRQQGALARAIGADDRGQAARCELAADRIQRQSPPVADRYIP